MSSSITLSNGNRLIDEMSSFDKKMAVNDSKVKKVKEELYGHINIDSMPFYVQEEFTRSKLNIPPHIWSNYSHDLRGKTIAIEVIKGQIETLERYEGILDRNKKAKK